MNKAKIDVLGVSFAALCLVHCLLFPLLMLFSISWLHNGWVDLLFFVFGIAPVYSVLKSGSPKAVKVLLVLSLALVGTAILLDFLIHLEFHLIYVGAVGLIVGHLLNMRSHRKKHYVPAKA